LPAIQALPYVAAANPDAECRLDGIDPLPMSDLSPRPTLWKLDAVSVTCVGGGRAVAYDGEGVYVAVSDTGLPHNWRAYFPEQRIATQFARCFGGGGGEPITVSDQPNRWEHDNDGHGITLTGIILGFA